jgi:hypothetical protein
MAHPIEAPTYLPEQIQPRKAIRIIKENILAPVATRSHMIEPTG